MGAFEKESSMETPGARWNSWSSHTNNYLFAYTLVLLLAGVCAAPLGQSPDVILPEHGEHIPRTAFVQTRVGFTIQTVTVSPKAYATWSAKVPNHVRYLTECYGYSLERSEHAPLGKAVITSTTAHEHTFSLTSAKHDLCHVLYKVGSKESSTELVSHRKCTDSNGKPFAAGWRSAHCPSNFGDESDTDLAKEGLAVGADHALASGTRKGGSHS